ncbi:1-acyl-sn-glycerol-3-phosphate acyltransferase [Enterococcus sp. DIV0840]|uniref:1-acyl-sn-glycerol-3-phosphate acyltransferase n=2 Tax=Enterococcus TaxID=1350 RepID=R2QVD4_9ENTE|nr:MULTISPECIES: 1-acyl-sn-glycerol-3-phosphate acyltransferase [Enterococcus]EOH99348.1 1-acylglycerol-3-phosphate O-acyltransferase [Enterococcus haemoperoxidus ATCC BAA-382]EOT62911.1 1-acyl-sn-glycerol-3-phosphate acyltransferase [Enterococcus haemoperoxidus ATCC BAA-382]MBO0435366.1 1-acyl-sn-glycerol-3-phosphate acyltransferase [Enterococcus sp. DIV0849a]MBO0474008.1 1-acyl-sn-glycerol-3-phosphate acyltransferase [Enterococcus ureasiticus]OEG14198.1 acyl-phosphate glycerol 3-phosphate ac
MFFTFMRGVVRVVLFIINGNAHYEKKDRIPQNENYILVAPHRTWWEPLYLAVGGSPKKFSFMAKKELFKNPFLSFILKHANAFPVDREKPGPSAIKTPVKTLKNTDLSLVMFPSGTRHSSELKGGVALIAKMAKVKIVPAVYQGPLTLKDLFKRRRVTVRFGEPIDVSDIPKMDKEGIAEVERRMQATFDSLDQEIDPNFKYEVKE